MSVEVPKEETELRFRAAIPDYVFNVLLQEGTNFNIKKHTFYISVLSSNREYLLQYQGMYDEEPTGEVNFTLKRDVPIRIATRENAYPAYLYAVDERHVWFEVEETLLGLPITREVDTQWPVIADGGILLYVEEPLSNFIRKVKETTGLKFKGTYYVMVSENKFILAKEHPLYRNMFETIVEEELGYIFPYKVIIYADTFFEVIKTFQKALRTTKTPLHMFNFIYKGRKELITIGLYAEGLSAIMAPAIA